MKHTVFKFITVIFLIFQIFTPIYYYIQVGAAVVMAVFVFATILLFPKLVLSKSMLYLLLYTLITILLSLTGNEFFGTINAILIPYFTVSSALLITGYTIKYRNNSYITTVIITSFILLVIITVISIPQVLINPNIIRGASVSAAKSENYQVYYWLIGYGVIHGLVAVITPLVHLVKNSFKRSKKLFVFWGVITLLLLYIIAMSNATTSLLITVFAVSAGLLINFSRFSIKNIMAFLLIGAIILLLFNKSTAISILDSTQSLFPKNSSNYLKITDIKTYLLYSSIEGTVGARDELYLKSSDLFRKSPLVGTSTPENIGYHSYILDRLAALGIVFIVPLFLVFFYHIKSVYKRLNQTKSIYLVGCLSYLSMLFLKNEFGSGTFLFAFALLPLFCMYIENSLYRVK